jgi:hypothetical protein
MLNDSITELLILGRFTVYTSKKKGPHEGLQFTLVRERKIIKFVTERESEEHLNFGVIYSHCGLSSQFWGLADIS